MTQLKQAPKPQAIGFSSETRHRTPSSAAIPAHARIIGVEPDGADDFHRSLASGTRQRNELPHGICDGLLSYDVGLHNWPILHRLVSSVAVIPDSLTQKAMRWWYETHGLRVEPSGAISTAALLNHSIDLTGSGDIVLIISGRNIDEPTFQSHISPE